MSFKNVGDGKKGQNLMHSLDPAWNGFAGVLEVSPTFEKMLTRYQAETIRREQRKGRRSSSDASNSGKAAAAFNAE